MHRTFISTIIAAALTITGISSTMAQAGEYRRAPQVQHRTQNNVDPLAATIAGLAALVIIGAAIENNGGFKKKAHRPKQHVQQNRGHNRNHAYQQNNRHHGHRANRGHGGHRQHGWNGRGHGRHNDGHRGHRHQRGNH